MVFFPIRRPCIGLHVGPRALTLAEIGRDWRRGGRGWRLRRVQRCEVPPGLVRLSFAEKNILDVPALAGHVRGLLGNRKGHCVALSLPDECARIALFDFENLPQKPAQVDSLLRWRFQKDLSVAVGNARMPYRVFHPRPAAGQPPTKVVKVLAAAVREEIVSQYEQMCEDAGVIPAAIGLSSLALLDSCRAAMRTSSDNALFLHLTDSGFAFVAFQQGCPTFFRIKALHPDSLPTAGGPDPAANQDAPGFSAEQLVQEVIATLYFYADRYVRTVNGSGLSASPLYLVKGQERLDPAVEDPGKDLGARLLSGSVPDSLNLNLITLDWNALSVARSRPEDPLPGSGLPALAALLAA